MCIESLYVFIRFLVYIIYTYLLTYVSFIHIQIHGTPYIYIATLGILPVIFERNPQEISPSASPAVRCFPKTLWKQPGEAPVRPGE